MTTNWLHAYLVESVRRDRCTKINCATCGAMEFRRGVLDALSEATEPGPRKTLDREAVIEIARALADITPEGSDSPNLVPAVRCLLFDLWSGIPLVDNDVETQLAGSWAGKILRAMKEHHATVEQRRRASAEFQDPANVQKRREEKKRLKQEQHASRMVAKQERDRVWREAHPNQIEE